jgi:hypothetical protein
MDIKKIFNVIEISTLVTIILTIVSHKTSLIPENTVLDIIAMILAMTLSAVYIIMAYLLRAGKLRGILQRDSAPISFKNFIFILMFLSNAIITTGVLYLIKNYPGGKIMAEMGGFTEAVLLIIFIISMPKYKNQPPFAVKYGNKSKIITFKNNEIIIRALVLLTLDIIAMFAFTTI